MEMMVIARYSERTAGGQWDAESGTTHAVPTFMPRTLCGIPVGTYAEGWERIESRHVTKMEVECRRCHKSLPR